MTDTCGICGGDGRIGNSFGLTTTCPGCHGGGRRAEAAGLLRDVTKTKASHHRTAPKAGVVVEAGPSTYEGKTLAAEVRACGSATSELKDRLIREIAEYEGSHGHCTQTFSKKIRKQIRARV